MSAKALLREILPTVVIMILFGASGHAPCPSCSVAGKYAYLALVGGAATAS